MAMTLRLTAAQSEALRHQAAAEGASMQDVARRAVESYIRSQEPEVPGGVLVDRELDRSAGAVEDLARWRD